MLLAFGVPDMHHQECQDGMELYIHETYCFPMGVVCAGMPQKGLN